MTIRSAAMAGMALATLGATAALPAQPVAGGASMRVLGEARPLEAWKSFCRRQPAECAVDTSQPATIALNKESLATIARVNKAVNREIAFVTDQDHHGEPDVWNLGEDGRGDEEDRQLLKRKRLADLGLSRRAMRITVVINERGEGEAALTIITDKGDYVLQSRTDAVELWHRTGHVFIKRESQDALGWVSLGGVAGPEQYDAKPKP